MKKILYAIQGTGNGHISRARDIIPELKKYADVDILISGTQSDLDIDTSIKYRLGGLGFVFGKKGGIDIIKTFREASIIRFLKEIFQLPIRDYDLVINDFEPVSAWASKLRNVPCVSLSHQCALLFEETPRPTKLDRFGWWILKKYAPSQKQYGFHFKSYHQQVSTPVIRKQIREAQVSVKPHYTVYLPSFSEQYLIKKLNKIKGVKWQVFSKHASESFVKGNVQVFPLSNKDFIKSMAESSGVLCGAGFETPAEALFLVKKLLVIPMRSQTEQFFNAQSLKEMGVMVIKNLKKGNLMKLQYWVDYGEIISVNYPNMTADIIAGIAGDFLVEEKDFSLIQKLVY